MAAPAATTGFVRVCGLTVFPGAASTDMMGVFPGLTDQPRGNGDRMSSQRTGPAAVGVGCVKTCLGCFMIVLPLLIVGFFVISAFTHSGHSSRPCSSSSCSSNNNGGSGGGGSDGGDDGGDGGGDGGGGGD
jgi:hypothetical protein